MSSAPSSCAAPATAFSESGWARPWYPTGAIPTGCAKADPSSVVVRSTVETSRSTRGRRRKLAQASEASPTVTSSPAPEAKNACTSAGRPLRRPRLDDRRLLERLGRHSYVHLLIHPAPLARTEGEADRSALTGPPPSVRHADEGSAAVVRTLSRPDVRGPSPTGARPQRAPPSRQWMPDLSRHP